MEKGSAQNVRILAGGEDYGYFAYEAGGRRFESCHGNYARVAQWIEHLPFRCRLFPGLNKLCGSDIPVRARL